MKNNTQIQNISFLRIGASLPNVRKNDLWMQVLHLCQQKCHLAVVSEAEKRAAMKSCVCWAGHHPQMLTPLPLWQQLLSAKICHLDCLCCLAAKIRWACINNIISKSMLFSWIWSQMTLPYRGAAVSLVWKRHYTAASTREQLYHKRLQIHVQTAYRWVAAMWTAHRITAQLLLEAVNSASIAELRYQPCPHSAARNCMGGGWGRLILWKSVLPLYDICKAE